MTFLEKTKKFASPLLESRPYLILSLCKFTFWAFYSLAVVWLIRETTSAIIQDDLGRFHDYVIFFSVFVFLYFINYIGRKWEWPQLYYITEKYISDNYVRKMMLLDGNYIEQIGSGRLVSIMQNGVKRWNEHLAFLIRDFTRAGVIFLVTIWVLYTMNSIFGALFIVIVIAMHIIVAWIDGFARDFRNVRTDKRNEYSRKLVQIIMSKSEILQNNQVDTRANELRSIHEEIESADTQVAFSIFFLFNLPRVFLAIARIGVLYFIGYGVFTGDFLVTDFIFAMSLLLMFESFLIDSIETYKNFTKDFSDVEKLWETIDNGPVMKGYSTGSTFTPKSQNIEIQNISYGYNDTKVFSDFSLTIERGKKTAFVGASGGGKTTLMKLIAGYLHPEKGSISIMGNKLDETALKTYYPHIGYLTQDPSVFDATIRENLVSAIAQQSGMTGPINIDEKLHEALRLAHCDFVFDLEKGLDTEIGERGVRLSGGQKQRLAIAKIFLKDPEIILLDEPTSALDSFSEEQITKALDELFVGRTVIIVAHRLQTVKKSDDIIVIEGGEVVERGDHDELVAKGGIYYKMLELQSGF